MKATGALLRDRNNALLVPVDVAMSACGKAGMGAPLLAAMAGIAELQPISTPIPSQAQPVQALTSGVTGVTV